MKHIITKLVEVEEEVDLEVVYLGNPIEFSIGEKVVYIENNIAKIGIIQNIETEIYFDLQENSYNLIDDAFKAKKITKKCYNKIIEDNYNFLVKSYNYKIVINYSIYGRHKIYKFQE